MGSQPANVVNAVPAPENWWLRGDLVPSKPQGEPSISRTGVGKWMCDIKFGNSQALQAAPGALVIPDATRAFYVSTRKDPSIRSEKVNETTTANYGPEGKEVCTIEPVIIMPTEQRIASGGGGKWGSIGAIGKTPSPNVEPAFLPLAIIPVAVGVEQLALWALGGAAALNIGITSQRWLKDHPAVVSNNIVVIPKGGDLIAATVEMSGLSAVEAGILTQDAAAIRGKIELLRDPSKVDPRSAIPSPGNCGDDEHQDLKKQVTENCKNTGQMTCDPKRPPFILSQEETMRRFNLNAKCAESRDKVAEMCFFGGDSTHRNQSADYWQAAYNCLSKLNSVLGVP